MKTLFLCLSLFGACEADEYLNAHVDYEMYQNIPFMRINYQGHDYIAQFPVHCESCNCN